MWCSWVLRVPEKGASDWDAAILWRAACPIASNPIGFDHNIGHGAARHSELPRALRLMSIFGYLYGLMSPHRYFENVHQSLGQAEYTWRAACPILWSNPIVLRYFTERVIAAPLCSLALRLRNTKVPVWTHESIGYPKMDISHWDAAIHYGVQLAQYCDQTLSCYAISRRLSPLCSLALRLMEHQSTCVDSWVHRVPEKGASARTRQFTMAFSLPNIAINTR